MCFRPQEFVNGMLKCDYSYEAIKQQFALVLLIMLYKVVLTFKSVDAILPFEHSNEITSAVLSCGAVCYAVQGDYIF